MLILSRKLGQKVLIGNSIWVTIIAIDRDKVRIGIDCDKDIPIWREELRFLRTQEQDNANSNGNG